MMIKLIFLFEFFLLFSVINAQWNPVITTNSGQLRGSRERSGLFHTFYAFKGIPYAKPPVGDLRFRNPVPHPNWQGLRDATSHGHACPFLSLGNEDCLFLNVYTQNLNGNLPVMFYIHGGAYVLGDGNDLIYGPDLLVREDVCVVTINYRLSSLGFLSTGDKFSQGNYGLKDAVLALKWVNQNIAAFGCDPTKITIFGQSAGAVTVNILMMSDMSKNLYHQAIMQSGTIFTPILFQTNPKAKAERLANSLGLTFNSTESMINELRKVEFRKIMAAERSLFNMDQPLGLRGFDFPVVVEPKDSQEETILSDSPLNILKNGNFSRVPLMIGTTSNEGLMMVRQYQITPEIFDLYNKNDDFFVPLSFNLKLPKDSKEIENVAEKFKEIYFHGKNLSSEMLVEFSKFHTDSQFKFPTDRLLSLLSKNSTTPIYAYNFGYSGAFNFLKTFLFLRNLPGASHFDDIFYLFTAGFPMPVWPTDHALTVRKRMIKLWTNFAKFGNPTPNTDNIIKEIWPKYSPVGGKYLDIDVELVARNYDEGNERLKVWREFQNRFTGHL